MYQPRITYWLCLLLSGLWFTIAQATTYTNYLGTATAPEWHNPSNWQPQGIPSAGDEVWMNTANTDVEIHAGEIAEANQLIVGRHALNASMAIRGGDLNIAGENSLLFVGQYEDASGLLILDGGTIQVTGELAIGVSGRGEYRQLAGATQIGGRPSLLDVTRNAKPSVTSPYKAVLSMRAAWRLTTIAILNYGVARYTC